jgi:hypothetical protein
MGKRPVAYIIIYNNAIASGFAGADNNYLQTPEGKNRKKPGFFFPPTVGDEKNVFSFPKT